MVTKKELDEIHARWWREKNNTAKFERVLHRFFFRLGDRIIDRIAHPLVDKILEKEDKLFEEIAREIINKK